MSERGERAVRAYVKALDLSCVLVATDPDRTRVKLFAANDPAGRLRAAAPPRPGTAAVLWCLSGAQAEFLAVSATAELAMTTPPEKGGWFSLDPDRAVATVQQVAHNLGVSFRSDAELEAAAVRAVAQVDRILVDAKARGDLKEVNRSYKAYRLACFAEGRSAMLFTGWMENYRQKMIRATAATARAIDRDSFGVIVAAEAAS